MFWSTCETAWFIRVLNPSGSVLGLMPCSRAACRTSIIACCLSARSDWNCASWSGPRLSDLKSGPVPGHEAQVEAEQGLAPLALCYRATGLVAGKGIGSVYLHSRRVLDRQGQDRIRVVGKRLHQHANDNRFPRLKPCAGLAVRVQRSHLMDASQSSSVSELLPDALRRPALLRQQCPHLLLHLGPSWVGGERNLQCLQFAVQLRGIGRFRLRIPVGCRFSRLLGSVRARCRADGFRGRVLPKGRDVRGDGFGQTSGSGEL